MADDLKFLIEDEVQLGTRIKVVGVGGGGSNAVSRMLQEGLGGIEFYILNTDKQALAASPVANKLAIGKKLTSGLGAGADPSIGRQAALEDTEHIIEILEGADMVFVTAGLGGGTGTGAAPVVASLAKELNALTVAVVTKPFAFEGPRRMRQAERGLAELGSSCDTLISIPNEKLIGLAPRGTSFMQSFRMADDVLRQAVQGIADIITTPGMINRDFSDIRTIMVGMGYAMMGTAIASGENAPLEAAQKAINSPLMEEGGDRFPARQPARDRSPQPTFSVHCGEWRAGTLARAGGSRAGNCCTRCGIRTGRGGSPSRRLRHARFPAEATEDGAVKKVGWDAAIRRGSRAGSPDASGNARPL
jgi:cell division protein FtsZ